MELQIPDRLYPNNFPQVGDMVMVRILHVEENNIRVFLLEYDCEGLLALKETGFRKIKKIRQAVRIGSQECMEVIDVDAEKGYIDLTRKQITQENKDNCTEYFTNAKRLYNYFARWSRQCDRDLVTGVLWEHYDSNSETDPYLDIVTDHGWLHMIPTDFRERMQEDFHKIFEQKAQKYELAVEMISYNLEGVKVLQQAVDKAVALSTEELPIHCIYTGKTGKVGNIFQLYTVTKNDPESTREQLYLAATAMQESLSHHQSRFLIVT